MGILPAHTARPRNPVTPHPRNPASLKFAFFAFIRG
jgi:hypothetical protein